jgi:hypothetical protein
MNLLQALLAAQSSAGFGTSAQGIPQPIQSIDPNTGEPVSGPILNGGMPQAQEPMPQFQGNFQRMTQGAPLEKTPSPEIMQAIGSSPATPAVEMPAQQSQQPQQSSQRPRRSFLDTLGQISDVLARVGGAEPLYQPTLDAREDRQRAIDLEELRRQQIEQQMQLGSQRLKAGEEEFADTARGRLAMALGAVSQSENPAEMWSQIDPEMLGLDPQIYAAVTQRIAANPQSAEVLAQSLGWSPNVGKGQGSLAKEVQLYQMLMQEGGPEMAKAYLQSLVNPSSMTEYQRATINLKIAEMIFEREKAAAEAAAEASNPAANLTPGQKRLDQAFGTVYNDYVARGGFADVQKGIQQLREVRDALRKGGITGGVSGYLPTPIRSIFNEKSVSAQEAVEEVVQRNLRLILGAQFTQKEGERLIERAYNPRLSESENIKRLDRLITQLETSARETESASAYFERYGTLNGWKGKLPGQSAPPPPTSPRSTSTRTGSGNRPSVQTPAAPPPPSDPISSRTIEAALRRRGLM